MAKNKLAKFAEVDQLENVFQPLHKEIFRKDYHLKGKWREEVFKNDNPIVLEIGCGKGEYTVGLGQLYPEKNFIGLDIKGARIWHGAKYASEHSLTNVAFIRMHAEMLESIFAPGEINEIWITFPDPQMAKARKRLTGSRFLTLYKQFLKTDGLVHLKTDSPFLFAYTDELIKLNGLPTYTRTEDLYASGGSDPILGIKTFYEQQWLSRGKKIKYLQFSMPGAETLKEPEVDIEKDDYWSQSRFMSGSQTVFNEK